MIAATNTSRPALRSKITRNGAPDVFAGIGFVITPYSYYLFEFNGASTHMETSKASAFLLWPDANGQALT